MWLFLYQLSSDGRTYSKNQFNSSKIFFWAVTNEFWCLPEVTQHSELLTEQCPHHLCLSGSRQSFPVLAFLSPVCSVQTFSLPSPFSQQLPALRHLRDASTQCFKGHLWYQNRIDMCRASSQLSHQRSLLASFCLLFLCVLMDHSENKWHF